MLNVFIVDDEPLVRAGIKYSINWEKYDMQVIGEADGVDNAIEAILIHPQIDIVFTDIVMPEKNGLELIKWIRKYRPLITTVVLSYYNDFTYIQEALRLGIVDYIVKTELDYPDVSLSLQRIADIAKSNQQNRHKLNLHQSEADYSYVIAIVALNESPLSLREQELACASDHFQVSQNTHLLLYPTKVEEAQLLEMEKYYQKVGILLTFDGIRSIPVSDIIIAIKLFMSRDFFYDYLPHLYVYDLDIQSILEEKSCLSGPDYMKVEEQLSSMQWINDDAMLNQILNTIRNSRLLPSSVYNLFYCVQKQWQRFFSIDAVPNAFPISGIRFWYQWMDWLNHFRTFIATQSKLSSYSHEVINSIQKLVIWLNNNFTKNVTLTEAAQIANLSQSYLSRCFKNIIGKPFNVYLRDLKVEYAKKILTQSDLQISRIAEISGFMDQFYFTKVFKKCTGMTPSEYRAKIRK